jgi:hypothetical protein
MLPQEQSLGRCCRFKQRTPLRRRTWYVLLLVMCQLLCHVSVKNAVFWDVTQCGSCKNYCLEERSTSIIRVTGIGELRTMLEVTSNRHIANVPSSPILVTLMMEALRSSETSVLTRATRSENLKSYIASTGCAL